MIVPKLREAGWDAGTHSFNEQQLVQFTDGRIVMAGSRIRRKPPKRGLPAEVHPRLHDCRRRSQVRRRRRRGRLPQAKDYAETLGLKFAYATNGHAIIELDYLTGTERELSQFPSPAELWDRYRNHSALADAATAPVLEPFNNRRRYAPPSEHPVPSARL